MTEPIGSGPDVAVAVNRFADVIERLVPCFGQRADRLGLAVSGGPDSLALLLLACTAFPKRIAVASVDHGTREAAAAECAFVARLCDEREVPHDTLTVAHMKPGNLQSSARAARYALLDDWRLRRNLDWIGTGHHADDQFETLLMRLARGSGIDGLSGVREVRGTVLRPLLGFRKTELEAIVAAHGIDPVRDPSNEDAAFDRVRVRAALDAFGPANADGPRRSAAALDAAVAALAWTADRLAVDAVRKDGEGCILARSALPADLPDELLRRLVTRCLHELDPDLTPRGQQLTDLIAGLAGGETRMIGDIKCAGGDEWRFSSAPPRRAR